MPTEAKTKSNNEIRPKPKDKSVQKTLFEVTELEEEREPYQIYKTDFFTIKTTESAMDRIIDKAEATKKVRGYHPRTGEKETKEVPKFSEKERKNMKMDWVQKKMTPTEPDINGAQWDGCRKSLYRQIFQIEF